MSWKKDLVKEIKNSELSIRQFSRDVNIQSSQMCDIINGIKRLTVKTAIKLEKKTSKDAEYWLTEQMKEELKKYR